MAGDPVDTVEPVAAGTVTQLSHAVVIAALTGVLAQFSIPLPGGIPFSFQPFAVFVAGILLGPLWGGFAMVLYLLVGIAGAPVFSNFGAGLGYVLGPTGGFLLGYVLAAVLIGALTRGTVSPGTSSPRSFVRATIGLLVGLVPIYGIGLTWFATVQGVTLAEGSVAMVPFFLGDLLKVAITVGTIRGGAALPVGNA